MPGVVERFAAIREMRSELIGRVARYGAGSVVATVCSQATFLVLYGPVGASTTVTSTLAWLAGAIPNYWLNRSWAWRRRGRPSLRGELLPYALIVAVTLLLATVATRAVDSALAGADISSSLRVALVAAAFFGVYVVMFVLRFFLFDRLFARLPGDDAPPAP